jgi:hypothetical protein
MTLEQIVMNAGDGKLRDQSKCALELKEFFSLVETNRLSEYANHCLQSAFHDSGFVLQDIVNELGRRLGFQVENGLYRGRRGAVGFDGIWRARQNLGWAGFLRRSQES